MTQFAVGQSGIQFGGGAFKWVQHADGSYGWQDPATGRTWDSYGNPYTSQAQQGAQPAQGGYVAPGAPTATPNALQQQQAIADPLVDWWRTHSGINVNAYNWGKLKTSVKETALAAAEAAGHDKGDVLEDIQRTLPRSVGPRRGYVAPLGA